MLAGFMELMWCSFETEWRRFLRCFIKEGSDGLIELDLTRELVRPSQSNGVIIRGQDSCDKLIISAPEKRRPR
jgi:hypothetical protein